MRADDTIATSLWAEGIVFMIAMLDPVHDRFIAARDLLNGLDSDV